MAQIEFNTGCALISIYFDVNPEDSRRPIASLHLGVKQEDHSVYKRKGGRMVYVDCNWIWGRATEPYDCCLEYFGLGPLMLVCW